MRDYKMFLGWMVLSTAVILLIPSVASASENVFYKDGELQYKDKSVWTVIDVSGEKGEKGEKEDKGENGQDGTIDTQVIYNLENQVNAGTASSFAMSQASNRFDDGFRLGLASFNDQTAIALGGRQDDLTFGLSFDTQDNVGISFGFDF